MRGETAEFWACKKELPGRTVKQSSTLDKIPRGNAFIERIVIFLDPSFGEIPEQAKSCNSNLA
jgi:hypothetical protein